MSRSLIRVLIMASFLVPALAGSQTRSAGDPVNRLCGDNFIGSFEVQGLEHFPEGTDYCKVSQNGLPPAILDAFREVIARDSEVAGIFGKRVDDLFSHPLKLLLRASPIGPLASSASPIRRPRTGIVPIGSSGGTTLSSLVTMTVFPDWPAGIGDPSRVLSPGIYLHELGHVISYNRDNSLPEVIHELAPTDLFTESFADTLALSGAGALFDSETLPQCLRVARTLTEHDSYDEPYGTFDILESRRKVVACCDDPAQAAAMDARTRAACEFMREAIRKDYPAEPPWDLSTLDPATAYAIPPAPGHLPIDPHQIGIPLNSFLLSLSRETGRRLGDLYFSALFRFSPEAPDGPAPRILPCAAGGKTFKAYDFQDVFRLIRASLQGRDVAVFDRLWTAHDMDKAMELATASAERCQPDI